MDLQAWSPIADIIAATAVVASMCILAFEIHLYRRQIRQESFDLIMSRRFDVLQPLATDEELASLVWRAFAANPRLPTHEWARFGLYMYTVMLEYERTWVKVNSGAIDTEVLDNWNSSFGWWFRHPGVRRWWRSDHPGFTPAFTNFVDEQAARIPEDGAIAQAVAASFRGELPQPPPQAATPRVPTAAPPPPSPAPGSP